MNTADEKNPQEEPRGSEPEEVIEAELISGDNFVGQVISCHDGQDGGYSFLGRIKRGYETIVTNGDVFVPGQFPVGSWVEFDDLNSDPKRPGKFRTETARLLDNALVKPEKIAALQRLTERSVYHLSAKEVDPDKVHKAAENLPFAEIIKMRAMANQPENQLEDVATMAQKFLAGTFANLSSLEVSYSVNGDVNLEAEEAKVQAAAAVFRENGLAGQATSLHEEYKKFMSVREAFTLMKINGILSLETVVPVKHLPDLLVAAPVWFVSAKEELKDATLENDPTPDHAVKFFCDLVGTREFAWFYQIYNRRTRPFSQFKGRDIIPLPLLKIMEQARLGFDYVIIATPYHDIASKEWSDPAWLRNIDPFLFGFIKDLPYMFLLGRWSGTGLFPLVLDMVADTMDHLRINKNKLGNFHSNSYWYRGLSEGTQSCLTNDRRAEEKNTVLIPFADQVLRAYEADHLFDFLRGEWPATEAIVEK